MLKLAFTLFLTFMPPCVEEDSTATVCAWNAQTRGNGEGYSFIALPGFSIVETTGAHKRQDRL